MTAAHLVDSPKAHWRLHKVLIDGGDLPGSDSLAIGWWDGEPRLASRWDRTSTSSKGNPFSRAPTWYVLPIWMHFGVLGAARLPAELRREALHFLGAARERNGDADADARRYAHRRQANRETLATLRAAPILDARPWREMRDELTGGL